MIHRTLNSRLPDEPIRNSQSVIRNRSRSADTGEHRMPPSAVPHLAADQLNLIEKPAPFRHVMPVMQSVFTGPVFVVRDNIDTDQIISAQFLNLVPTIPEEYEKLGSFALCGLPKNQYPTRYIPEGQTATQYTIVIGGRNF